MPDRKSAEDGANLRNANNIASLIASLAESDGLDRQEGRKQLVSLGTAAVPSLIECMTDPRQQVRWEAAKALETIADPSAAGTLVKALEDKDGDVRWLAAMGLVALGRKGLRPLLVALVQKPDSDRLRDGAHHVCHALRQTDLGELIDPLFVAINEPEPQMAVPGAAQALLVELG